MRDRMVTCFETSRKSLRQTKLNTWGSRTSREPIFSWNRRLRSLSTQSSFRRHSPVLVMDKQWTLSTNLSLLEQWREWLVIRLLLSIHPRVSNLPDLTITSRMEISPHTTLNMLRAIGVHPLGTLVTMVLTTRLTLKMWVRGSTFTLQESGSKATDPEVSTSLLMKTRTVTLSILKLDRPIRIKGALGHPSRCHF